MTVHGKCKAVDSSGTVGKDIASLVFSNKFDIRRIMLERLDTCLPHCVYLLNSVFSNFNTGGNSWKFRVRMKVDSYWHLVDQDYVL